MQILETIRLKDVQEVYNGPEGQLWELIMGTQVHIGGMKSSLEMARRAGLGPGMNGIDLCCCSGAGMRFLARIIGVRQMIGVDATRRMILAGKNRNRDEGLEDRIEFVEADVCASGLEDGCADFVWGEDAWCYVVDKAKLIAEATRLVKKGGVIAFTDWMEGVPMTPAEAQRILRFMKFPNVLTLEEYRKLLQYNSWTVTCAEDTGRFTPYVELYLNMLEMQLSYDALKIINFDTELMGQLAGAMQFMAEMARQGKIIQGMIVARKH